jgi:recyclin-1
LSGLVRDERVWEAKWEWLGVDRFRLGEALDELEERSKARAKVQGNTTVKRDSVGQDIGVLGGDDDFGDFASASAAAPTSAVTSSNRLFSLSQGVSLSLHPSVLSTSSKPSFRTKFIRAHSLLKPLLQHLSSAPHLVLTGLFPPPNPPAPTQQARTLHLLALYLSHPVKPVHTHKTLHASLRSAIDRFQANLLTMFEAAEVEGQRDEKTMREVAHASWDVWEGRGNLGTRSVPLPASEWELGKVWAEKKEIFYEQGQWQPLDNFTYVPLA